MTTSIRDFNIGLYAEYLEEASFLYEQRLALLHDPEITWRDIGDFEERFEAHIDGLVVGGDLALEVCKQQAVEGDFGELHAAVRVFCRQDRRDLLDEVLQSLDPEDPEKIRAARDALGQELPTAWNDALAKFLTAENDVLTPLAARVLAYRRIPIGGPLIDLLYQGKGDWLPDVAWSLGRIRDGKARDLLLQQFSRQTDETFLAEASIALLRIHEPHARSTCLERASDTDWALRAVGLSGDRTAVPVLLRRASSDQPPCDALIALGSLGHISAVDTLLTHLSSEDTAEAAAVGLELICGAGVFEDVFVPEEVDEDALFDDEKEQLARGESITPPGQEPPGETIHRLCQDPAVWRAWWEKNASRFEAKFRYRSGWPVAPVVLLDDLERESTPHPIRRIACEELVIRYGAALEIETDFAMRDQVRSIARCRSWLEAEDRAFKPGAWYFAGKVCIDGDR